MAARPLLSEQKQKLNLTEICRVIINLFWTDNLDIKSR